MPDVPARSDHRAVSRRVKLFIAGLGVLVLVAAAAIAFGGGGDDGGAPVASTPLTGTSPEPVAEPRELEPETAEDRLGSGYVGLKVSRSQLLRTRPDPNGRLVGKALKKTPYGQPTILPIIKARGDWVAVVSPYRKNNKVTWTKVDDEARFVAIEYSIAIRVKSRLITVRRNGKVVRRMKAAVGDVTHPTPGGRFAVTDGLIFKKAARGPYGCCALVLSARQTDLPPQWGGGDRIAIHGTSAPESIGLAASLGCLRVGDKNARWLVENVPAGATVRVRTLARPLAERGSQAGLAGGHKRPAWTRLVRGNRRSKTSRGRVPPTPPNSGSQRINRSRLTTPTPTLPPVTPSRLTAAATAHG